MIFFHVFQCQPVSGRGFVTGAYNCLCRDGFYFPHSTGTYFSGTEIEKFHREGLEMNDNMFNCVTCAPGCDTCVDNSPCLFRRNKALLIFLTIMMVFTIIGIIGVATLAFLYRAEMVCAILSHPIDSYVSYIGTPRCYQL